MQASLFLSWVNQYFRQLLFELCSYRSAQLVPFPVCARIKHQFISHPN